MLADGTELPVKRGKMAMAVVEPAAIPSGWLPPRPSPGIAAQSPRRWPVTSESALPDSGQDPPEDLPETRAMIEQAKGILMATYRCGPDEASVLLRRASRAANVKIHVLAARLIAKALD